MENSQAAQGTGIRGRMAEQATTPLEPAGFVIGTIDSDSKVNSAAGAVVDQTPPAGRRVCEAKSSAESCHRNRPPGLNAATSVSGEYSGVARGP
jgi:hypothetical protein